MAVDAENKAKELVDKFEQLEHDTYDGWGTMQDFSLQLAKQCALICVDEIIEAEPSSPYNNDYYELHSDRIDAVKEYYKQVKIEIEKL